MTDDVLAAFDALDRAFERHDTTALRALCIDEMIFLGSAPAERAASLDELVELLEGFDGDLGMFTVRWDDRRVRVEGDAAWVAAAGEAVWQHGSLTERFPYRLTGVLVRRDGGWRWALHHGSEPVERT